MDTVGNCEALMSKLLRKEKLSSLRSNMSSSKTIKSNVSRIAPKSKTSTTTKPQANTKVINFNSTEGYINPNVHNREIHSENTVVEIPSKNQPKPKSRQNAAGDREPWCKLLQPNSSSKFSNFDPLRTLHFLAKELQYKLQANLPEDEDLQQIVADMQNAITRVPPEIASAIKLQNSSDTIPLRKSSSSSSVLNSKKQLKATRSSQTVQNYQNTELIQKLMEGSTQKLEASCRQMEMLCGRLKSEKEDLEEQLKTEKDNVKFLKKRVGDLEVQCEQLVTVTIKRLEEEKNELQLQVNRLTDVVDSQSVHTSFELKNVNQELKQVQMKAEQECMKLKHQLTLANMEKEKYIAILCVRDKQINEIRSEMSQLQDVVNEQLMEIHNNALMDLPSNNSIDIENAWVAPNKEKVEDINENATVLSNGESSNNQQKTTKKNSNFDEIDNKQSIRNMFAELKKQAFAVVEH